ncbi:hypothetical protein [Bifidobacterium myosotis]|uniref:Uncharacterized protein n=1 Tax=Bifidobacterium myosotis TaxID=1630166 RepID=A0A5M9ZL07_9BIFI|nr:hypothetical protein [Bifidobacterium myosotis]KAA8828119.1 hypothetical protein EMO91_06675 [Bifidobacterium myosotis]
MTDGPRTLGGLIDATGRAVEALAGRDGLERIHAGAFDDPDAVDGLRDGTAAYVMRIMDDGVCTWLALAVARPGADGDRAATMPDGRVLRYDKIPAAELLDDGDPTVWLPAALAAARAGV